MFVRFRQGRKRLALSIVETRWRGGKVVHEHIATLGSITTPPSIHDRIELGSSGRGSASADARNCSAASIPAFRTELPDDLTEGQWVEVGKVLREFGRQEDN
jgi:hypothetical protein